MQLFTSVSDNSLLSLDMSAILKGKMWFMVELGARVVAGMLDHSFGKM